MANRPMCHDVLPDCNNSTLPAQYIRTLSIKHMRSGFFFRNNFRMGSRTNAIDILENLPALLHFCF